ncbi:recombinase family protein [uncultured Microbacterium sp.]|uniref:recombinase family protein n=1 Tax=uncultured Microbacterium sp. TaxID=191216 RepID=UPI0028F024C5|nr:recombinase family protein [uncultured Microbacterium sp.]
MTPKSAKPLRAAIYARQSVAEPEGIRRQVEACRALADARDYLVVDTYEDDSVSGYRERGEGTAFARMLADARAGKFDVLIVRKLDRLGRSLAALEALTAAKVNTVTTDGALDLASPSGRLVANVLTSVARAESEVKAERRVFANADRRTKGVPTSGRVPYGYIWVPMAERGDSGTAYVLDDERAPDVRRIYDEFLAGVPLGSIARDLNLAGRRTLPTKRHPEGVPFSPTTLRRILMSPYYAALLPLPREDGGVYDQRDITRDSCVEGAWPAIVTVDEWAEAKTRLEHPERKTSPGPTRKWLLSGIALCGVCKQPVRAGGGERGIHSYRCGSMAHFMRRGVPLDDFVERLVVARLERPDAVDLLVDRERPDVDALRAERRRLEVSLRELGDDHDDGLVGRAEYQRRLKRLNARVAELDGKLQAGANVEPLRDLVGASNVRGAWDALPLGRKRAVLEALLTIEVHSVGQGNRRNMPDEAMARTLTITWH